MSLIGETVCGMRSAATADEPLVERIAVQQRLDAARAERHWTHGAEGHAKSLLRPEQSTSTLACARSSPRVASQFDEAAGMFRRGTRNLDSCDQFARAKIALAVAEEPLRRRAHRRVPRLPLQDDGGIVGEQKRPAVGTGNAGTDVAHHGGPVADSQANPRCVATSAMTGNFVRDDFGLDQFGEGGHERQW